jgi:hypothetical protein
VDLEHDAPGGAELIVLNNGALLLAALVAVSSAGKQAVSQPITSVGGPVVLNYLYLGHVSSDGSESRETGTLAIGAPQNNISKIEIRHAGKVRRLGAQLRSNGEFAPLAPHSDLLRLYDAIPSVLHEPGMNRGGMAWQAAVPVLVSETEWRDVPVRVTSTVNGNRTVLDVSGRASEIVFDHGFTVGEDVALEGRVTFNRGTIAIAHFIVHEVVHTFTDIPIAYEWTMSR